MECGQLLRRTKNFKQMLFRVNIKVIKKAGDEPAIKNMNHSGKELR